VSDTYLLGLNDKRQVVGLFGSGSFVAQIEKPHDKDDSNDKMVGPATNALDVSQATRVIHVAQKSTGTGNGANCANAEAVGQIRSGEAVHFCQGN